MSGIISEEMAKLAGAAAAQLSSGLEPGVSAIGPWTPQQTQLFLASIAISIKRLADAMERRHDAMLDGPHDGLE